MSAPICVKCRKTMHCLENGVPVRHYEPSVFRADLYECRGCGAQVITGFSKHSYAVSREAYQAAFEPDPQQPAPS